MESLDKKKKLWRDIYGPIKPLSQFNGYYLEDEDDFVIWGLPFFEDSWTESQHNQVWKWLQQYKTKEDCLMMFCSLPNHNRYTTT